MTVRNTVASGKDLNVFLARSYFQHGLLGQFRRAVGFSMQLDRLAFHQRISSIIGLCSQVKVRWINAKWIVLDWAVVKYARCLRWNRASCNEPRANVGSDHVGSFKLGFPPCADTAVFADGNTIAFIAPGRSTNPQPTGIGHEDLLPKPLRKGGRKSLRLEIFRRIVWPRNQFHWLRHALGCLFTARAFSFSTSPR